MYFETCGKEHTERCIALALDTAASRGIKHVVLASSTGKAAQLLPARAELNLVCVTSGYGYKAPGKKNMPDTVEKELLAKGIKVLATTHVLSGAERGLSKKHGGVYPVELISDTLRMFGQGTKVCVEIATMALDTGLIPYGEDILAIGGTGAGADTVLILRPAHANNILDTKIKEYICKPRNF